MVEFLISTATPAPEVQSPVVAACYCPLCKRLGKASVLISAEICPVCGSLEGFDAERDLPAPSGSVGHDWQGGSVAPWRTRDGKEAYATPTDVCVAALEAAGLAPLAAPLGTPLGGAGEASPAADSDLACQAPRAPQAVVIDLGCGDGQIVRAAASHFGAFGIGLDLDDGALGEARLRVAAEGLAGRVVLRRADFTKLDLRAEVRAARRAVAASTAAAARLRQEGGDLGDAWGCSACWNEGEGGEEGGGSDYPERPGVPQGAVVTGAEKPCLLPEFPVVVAAYLLPTALEQLRAQLQGVVDGCGATVVTVRWDMGLRWAGEAPGARDDRGRFTVYRPKPRPAP